MISSTPSTATTARPHRPPSETSADGARALVATAIDTFGRLDIVVNSAGIFTNDAFPEMDAEWLRRRFAVHIEGSFNMTQAAWPHMTRAGYGRVVLTTSTRALGAYNTIAYGTAKAAVLGLGRGLAQVGRKAGIKVNMVAPMAFTRMMVAGMIDAGIDVPDDIIDRGPTWRHRWSPCSVTKPARSAARRSSADCGGCHACSSAKQSDTPTPEQISLRRSSGSSGTRSSTPTSSVY